MPVAAHAQERDSRHEIVQPGEPARDDDANIETATPDPTPGAVSLGDDGIELQPDVVEQAGVGGPVPYAASGVLEVGGAGSFFGSENGAFGRLRPFIGWFVFDAVELTYGNDLVLVEDANGEVVFAVTATLEPSVHIPLIDRLWLAIGVAGGIVYNGVEVGAALAPRLGIDVLVGRSGMLHVSGVATFATVDLRGPVASPDDAAKWRVGAEIAYAVLF